MEKMETGLLSAPNNRCLSAIYFIYTATYANPLISAVNLWIKATRSNSGNGFVILLFNLAGPTSKLRPIVANYAQPRLPESPADKADNLRRTKTLAPAPAS